MVAMMIIFSKLEVEIEQEFLNPLLNWAHPEIFSAKKKGCYLTCNQVNKITLGPISSELPPLKSTRATLSPVL